MRTRYGPGILPFRYIVLRTIYFLSSTEKYQGRSTLYIYGDRCKFTSLKDSGQRRVTFKSVAGGACLRVAPTSDTPLVGPTSVPDIT